MCSCSVAMSWTEERGKRKIGGGGPKKTLKPIKRRNKYSNLKNIISKSAGTMCIEVNKYCGGGGGMKIES